MNAPPDWPKRDCLKPTRLKRASLAITRRGFLAGAAAAAGSAGLMAPMHPTPLLADMPAKARALAARAGTANLLGKGQPATPIWGYDGTVPGPVLRVKRGDELAVMVKNELDQPTTVHWHGIRIDNAMDGVPGLTQDPIAPGASFEYRFICPDAGSFWYHSHERSWEQVARGLYGMLIVEEESPPQIDRDIPLVLDDWRLTDAGEIDNASFGALHDWAHAGRLGNTLTANGLDFAELEVEAHQRVRLRLLNASNARVLQIQLAGVLANMVAIDGQPIAPTSRYDEAIALPPAGRVDLIFDVPDKPGSVLPLAEMSGEPLEIARFNIAPAKSEGRREPLVAPIALKDNPLPNPDLANAQAIELRMQGGAMGRLAGAMLDGQMVPLRDLAMKHRIVWAFNGAVTHGSHGGHAGTEPLFRIKRGETASIRMINETAWPHAMHVHGHHFQVTARSKRDLDPYWWDTLLMDPQEEATIAFVADNPGKWLLHCHMLEHHAGGMGTWFEVVA